VQIDTCYNCGGLFLDNGEFDKIRTHFKKRQKVQPQDIKDKDDIVLSDFYKYEAEIGTKSLSGLNWILNMLDVPLHHRYGRFF
jgi:Zn-finger nucleic acid-binding protein